LKISTSSATCGFFALVVIGVVTGCTDTVRSPSAIAATPRARPARQF
jgi:hypothetical protein